MKSGVIDIDKGWKRFRQNIATMKSLRVDVGVFPKAKYPDGTPVALVATVQEFGSPKRHIPERSYMRTAFDENIEKILADETYCLEQIKLGEMKPKDALGYIGERHADRVKEKIHTNIQPALQQTTIDARERRVNFSTDTLIDTGRMVGAIEHKISKA